jgi:hypothetical protein
VPHALLVLPKWQGVLDFKKPTWIRSMELLPRYAPVDVLREVVEDPKVFRSEKPLEQESTWLGGKYKINQPQTFGGREVEPLVTTPDGILLDRLIPAMVSFGSSPIPTCSRTSESTRRITALSPSRSSMRCCPRAAP